MRFVVGRTSFESESRAIQAGLSLTPGTTARREAYAVVLPDYLIEAHPELLDMRPWHWRTPDGSYEVRKDGSRYCSTEFAFLLLARDLTIPELALFAYEQCGTYAIDESDPKGFVTDCVQRTTKDRLCDFLEECPGAPGSDKAHQALRWIADRSASPMESCLTLLLCLPQRLGGFGLPLPELNRKLSPSELSSWPSLASSRSVKADLIWLDALFALEYDSDLAHTGRDRIARDSKRRVVFAAMRIQSISVTNEQITDTEEMMRVARLVAKALGRRLNRCGKAFRARHATLRELLLSFTVSSKDDGRPS